MKPLLLISVLILSLSSLAQSDSPFVSFDQYEKLVNAVKEHRSKRMVSLDEFNRMSQLENVVILDTRSDSMYHAVHIKGAVHLNFSDFTQAALDALFGSRDVTILIYCNNNFIHQLQPKDELNLAELMAYVPTKMSYPQDEVLNSTPITLALNIPTYINLFGYGYQNVYELKELVDVNDSRIQFEGAAVDRILGTFP